MEMNNNKKYSRVVESETIPLSLTLRHSLALVLFLVLCKSLYIHIPSSYLFSSIMLLLLLFYHYQLVSFFLFFLSTAVVVYFLLKRLFRFAFYLSLSRPIHNIKRVKEMIANCLKDVDNWQRIYTFFYIAHTFANDIAVGENESVRGGKGK
jgi:hypothetical protein